VASCSAAPTRCTSARREPRPFTFPADHGPHPEFRTEWWYFTGNLTAEDGREFGYQLTFFRSALTDSATFAFAHPDRRAHGGRRHLRSAERMALGTRTWRTSP
jgi:predicted secreted hydrolase